jgi:hypothetical protein
MSYYAVWPLLPFNLGIVSYEGKLLCSAFTSQARWENHLQNPKGYFTFMAFINAEINFSIGEFLS